jgi:hypothetical protein
MVFFASSQVNCDDWSPINGSLVTTNQTQLAMINMGRIDTKAILPEGLAQCHSK